MTNDATNEEPKGYWACAYCGSPNISADAATRWDYEHQCWETVNVFDKGHSCDDCEDECRIEWKIGNPEDYKP